MTRNQFEQARRSAVAKYMDNSLAVTNDELSSKRQKANATRRFNRCADLLTEWDFDGFWTTSNTAAYHLLYKEQSDTDSVSAF